MVLAEMDKFNLYHRLVQFICDNMVPAKDHNFEAVSYVGKYVQYFPAIVGDIKNDYENIFDMMRTIIDICSPKITLPTRLMKRTMVDWHYCESCGATFRYSNKSETVNPHRYQQPRWVEWSSQIDSCKFEWSGSNLTMTMTNFEPIWYQSRFVSYW